MFPTRWKCIALAAALVPASAGGQITYRSAQDYTRGRSDGGVRVVSAGAIALGAGDNAAQAALGGNLSLPLQKLRLGVDAWFAHSEIMWLEGAAAFLLGVPLLNTWLTLEAGGAALPDEHDGPSVVTLGASIEKAGFSISVASNTLPGVRALYRDTITADSVNPIQRILVRPGQPRSVVADAEIRYRRELNSRVEVNAAIGHRLAGRAGEDWWGRGGIAYALTPAFHIGATAGRTGEAPWLQQASHSFAALFIRFNAARSQPLRTPPSPARAAVESLRIETRGPTLFTVVALDARSVDIAGDFSDWAPRSMRQVRSGTWQLELHLAPGVYHLVVRTDGGRWAAPPGFPAVPDELGGESAIFVVR